MSSHTRSPTSRFALWAGAAAGAFLIGRELRHRLSEADLTGQVALITGGTSGLGYLLAREFGSQDCKVVICARDENELRHTRDSLEARGIDVLPVVCDVADQEQVDSMIDRANSHFGRVDILVNNAGVIQFGPFGSMEIEDFERAMDTMYWGTVYPTMAVIPQMTKRGYGRIVNITSIGGKVSVPHLLPYSTAKFAAVGFSEGLRTEVMKDGIVVTTIVPGLMRTGSYFSAEFKGDYEQEFTWFSLGSSLPLITIDAQRAARQIVQATRRGEAERILSLPANILAKAHGLFPNLTSDIMALADRYMLPQDSGQGQDVRIGHDIQERDVHSTALLRATILGRESAERLQPPDTVPDEVWIDPRD